MFPSIQDSNSATGYQILRPAFNQSGPLPSDRQFARVAVESPVIPETCCGDSMLSGENLILFASQLDDDSGRNVARKRTRRPRAAQRRTHRARDAPASIAVDPQGWSSHATSLLASCVSFGAAPTPCRPTTALQPHCVAVLRLATTVEAELNRPALGFLDRGVQGKRPEIAS